MFLEEKARGAVMSKRLCKRENETFEGVRNAESLLIEVVDDALEQILGKDATENSWRMNTFLPLPQRYTCF
jgi:hypothetical protein